MQGGSNNTSTNSQAKKITVKRWKQTSGQDIVIVIGDIVPVAAGIMGWWSSDTFVTGLIWGGVTFVIVSYLILPILTIPMFVGLNEAELRQVVGNFCKNADNEAEIDIMAIGRRRFSLYCEITEDGKSYIGLKLPWKYWRDLYDDNMRSSLKKAGAAGIIEAEKNIYVYGPRDTDTENALSLINCLFDITDSTLRDLAVVVVTTYAVPIFSDLPPKTPEPNDGIKKK